MTFPILASLLVRLVVLLPFQLLRLSLATPSRWTPLDRKSGSAGMPRPISYAVFCLKKKIRLLRVSGIVMRLRMFLMLITFLNASHSFRIRLLVICKILFLFITLLLTSTLFPYTTLFRSCWSDWSSYYHFNYSGYRWRLLRDGRRWRSPSFSIASWPCYSLYCRHFYFLCPSSSRS